MLIGAYLYNDSFVYPSGTALGNDLLERVIGLALFSGSAVLVVVRGALWVFKKVADE
jgi:hypothetical protein